MILSGQPYATVALLGAFCYASLRSLGVDEIVSELVACTAAFSLRAWAILYDVRMGPPGQFMRIGKRERNRWSFVNPRKGHETVRDQVTTSPFVRSHA